MDRRDQSLAWPYKQCKEERDSQIWAGGMTPQTYACYKSALDFTTLSKYETEVRIATVSDAASWHRIDSLNVIFEFRAHDRVQSTWLVGSIPSTTSSV